MFTGLIEATAPLLERTDRGITVERPASFDDVRIGSSIAVSGVCLTIVELTDESMRFDVVEETWEKTRLGSLEEGELVNLERAMKAGGRLDGHVVQGHVEGVGKVLSNISSLSAGVPPPPSPLPRGERGDTEQKDIVHKKALNSMIRSFARGMRHKPTPAEEKFWEAARDHRLGYHFRRQHPLGGRILDFYCHDLRLGIEVDGGIHLDKQQKKEDEARDQFLREEKGIRILRFTNAEIENDLDSVIRKIITLPPLPSGEGAPTGGVGEHAEEQRLTLQLPHNLIRFALPKGSIALDGVSLTIADIVDDTITVALVPHTLRETTLSDLQPGDPVNIETDMLVRAALQGRQ